MNRLLVKGFIKISEATSTALIPFFCTPQSNRAFVQDMDKSFFIQSFAPFDMSLVSNDQIVTLKRGVEKSVGDQGLVAFLLADFGIIHGSRAEVVAGLRNFGSYSELPEFLHLEIADLLEDPSERNAAIQRASRSFKNRSVGVRWAAREGVENIPSKRRRRSRTANKGESLSLVESWEAIRAKLRRDCGARTFDGWLRPITLGEFESNKGILGLELPSQFMADWVKTHFAEQLQLAWQAAVPAVTQLDIRVGASASTMVAALDPSDGKIVQPKKKPRYGGALEPRYRFENFVVGKANEVAFSAAMTLATADNVAFNPLFLHGGTGRGKTHLLHAIGHEFRRLRPRAKIVYMSAEKFMVEFVAALRANDTIKFKQHLRAADLLLIDDVQFIAGKESAQEEFFHTMNEIISAGRRLVISSDRAPQDLGGVEPRILSRLSWGLVADINQTDLEFRLNIILKKLEALPEVTVPEDVIMFVAKRISSNVRELEGALNRIAAYAVMQNRVIDVDFVKEVLANTLRANQRRISIDEIQTRVSEHYRIGKAEMTSARRAREVARPRQIAMYLAKQLTPRSLPEIGRRFGGRDHTAIIYAVRQIEKLRAQDAELDADIRLLTRQLEG